MRKVQALSKDQQRQYLNLYNTYTNGNKFTGIFQTNALPFRDIEQGEEITICYGEQGAFDARRDFLIESFGFECDCGVCSLPVPERQESDARRIRIEQLDKVMGNMEHAVSKPVSTTFQIETRHENEFPHTFYDVR
ncbi:hypothetical protein J4E83_003064 [Alternaria metachromatica]|uniref:uncharacterized protein n=1 Tax=Alternaria metachromatica TaxID=283354 RepID=UPI0020C53EBA|nr:uncharacterized protein J4E83_003064 [Alternaria metachromatica]KAI4628514.1 hypothetical protein J4E83_003064 [Alternaria metachromatica]